MDNLDDQLDQWIAEAPPLPAHLQAASDRITAKISAHIWSDESGKTSALQLGEWWFELTYIPEWEAFLARRLDNPPTEE